EEKRLAALREYGILDTAAEQVFDDIATLSAYICKVPSAYISLIDENRQWFKARVGIEAKETPRDVSFCAHTIVRVDPMIVPDATKDLRFADSTLVTQEPHMRFYAGFPLVDPDGNALGS